MHQQALAFASDPQDSACNRQLASPETLSSSTALHIAAGPPHQRSKLTLPVGTNTSMEAANTMDITMDHVEGTGTAYAGHACPVQSTQMDTEDRTPPTSANSFAAAGGQQIVKQEGTRPEPCGPISPEGLQTAGPSSGGLTAGVTGPVIPDGIPDASQRSGSCGDETGRMASPGVAGHAMVDRPGTAMVVHGMPGHSMHMQEDEGAWEPEGRPPEDPDTEDGGGPGEDGAMGVADGGPPSDSLIAVEAMPDSMPWPAMAQGQQLPGAFSGFGGVGAGGQGIALGMGMGMNIGQNALVQARSRPAGSIYGHYRSKKVQLSPARLLHIPRNLIEESLDIETILTQGINIEIETNSAVQPPNITASVAVYKNSTGHSYYRILGFKPVCRQYQGWMLDCWKAVDPLTVRMCISWPGDVPAPEPGHADLTLPRHSNTTTDLRSSSVSANAAAAAAAAAAAKQKRARTQLMPLGGINSGLSNAGMGGPSSADNALMMQFEGPPSKVHSSNLRLSTGLLSEPSIRGPPSGSLLGMQGMLQHQHQQLNLGSGPASASMMPSHGGMLGLGESVTRGVTQVVDADGQVWTLSPNTMQLTPAAPPAPNAKRDTRPRSGLVLGTGLENGNSVTGPDSCSMPRWDQLQRQLPQLVLADCPQIGPNSGSTPSTTTQVLVAGQGGSGAAGQQPPSSSGGMVQLILPNGQQVMVSDTPSSNQLPGSSTGGPNSGSMQQQAQAQLLSALNQSGMLLQGLSQVSLGGYNGPPSNQVSGPPSGLLMSGMASGSSLASMQIMQELSVPQQYSMVLNQQQQQSQEDQKPTLVQAMLTIAGGTENVLLMQTPQGLMVVPSQQHQAQVQNAPPSHQLNLFMNQQQQQQQQLQNNALQQLGLGSAHSGNQQHARLNSAINALNQQQQQQQLVMLNMGSGSTSFQDPSANRNSNTGADASSIQSLINGLSAAGNTFFSASGSQGTILVGNDAAPAQQQQQSQPAGPSNLQHQGVQQHQAQQHQAQQQQMNNAGQQIVYTIMPNGTVQANQQQLLLSGLGGGLALPSGGANGGGLMLQTGSAQLDFGQQLSLLQQQQQQMATQQQQQHMAMQQQQQMMMQQALQQANNRQ